MDLPAGCAGFASVFADIIGEPSGTPYRSILPSKLLVSCGSMNPVSVLQLDTAENAGIYRKMVPASLKLADDTSDFPQFAAVYAARLKAEGCAIIDANDPKGSDDSGRLAEMLGISPSLRRRRISENLAKITKLVMDDTSDTAVLCTGGDSLRALMHELGKTKLRPVKELYAGVVLAELQYAGRTWSVITKSGGFGEPDLLIKLLSDIRANNKEMPKYA